MEIYILPFVFFIIIFGIIISSTKSRSKRLKARQDMLSSLKKGDQIVTRGGLSGKIVSVSDKKIELEISKGFIITLIKTFVLRKDRNEKGTSR